MIHRMRGGLVLALMVLLVAAPAAAEPVKCTGTLSGAVTAKFSCAVTLVDVGDGMALLDLRLDGPVEGVQSFAPGSFQVPLPVQARRYAMEALGQGRASLIDAAGTLFSATRTTRSRGDVTIVLRGVERDAARPGSWIVHGTYRARLVPSGSATRDEVHVDVSF